MQDLHGRTITYLRISVTQSCPMRCTYCRPTQLSTTSNAASLSSLPTQKLSDNELSTSDLSTTEIVTFVQYLAEHHGLKKVRLTGGEPTDRHDLLELVQRLSQITPQVSLAMTTNGLRLPQLAESLARAGLQRVNISLDSLDRQTFIEMTGVDGLSRVISGIDAAASAGLSPVKLNTVVMRDVNEQSMLTLLDYAATSKIELRFIELMPMGPLADQWGKRFISASQMRDQLSARVVDWQPLAIGTEAARRFRVTLDDGREALLGFISAMSCPFCRWCDRIRIASDGQLFPCLMDHASGNITDALRPVFNASRMDLLLRQAMSEKPEEHPATGYSVMTQIGG